MKHRLYNSFKEDMYYTIIPENIPFTWREHLPKDNRVLLLQQFNNTCMIVLNKFQYGGNNCIHVSYDALDLKSASTKI